MKFFKLLFVGIILTSMGAVANITTTEETLEIIDTTTYGYQKQCPSKYQSKTVASTCFRAHDSLKKILNNRCIEYGGLPLEYKEVSNKLQYEGCKYVSVCQAKGSLVCYIRITPKRKSKTYCN